MLYDSIDFCTLTKKKCSSNSQKNPHLTSRDNSKIASISPLGCFHNIQNENVIILVLLLAVVSMSPVGEVLYYQMPRLADMSDFVGPRDFVIYHGLSILVYFCTLTKKKCSLNSQKNPHLTSRDNSKISSISPLGCFHNIQNENVIILVFCLFVRCHP